MNERERQERERELAAEYVIEAFFEEASEEEIERYRRMRGSNEKQQPVAPEGLK